MKGLIGVVPALAFGLAVAGEVAARSTQGGSRPYHGGSKHSESHGGPLLRRTRAHEGGCCLNPPSNRKRRLIAVGEDTLWVNRSHL